MKKITKNFSLSLFFIIFSVVILTYSCSKDRIESKNAYSPLNTYMDTKKQAEQEFIVDSSGSGPIVGNQGTQIWPNKQCLIFPNGDSVGWPFSIKLVELYTPKDMIYYEQPTVSSAGILNTDGEIRLTAFKDGIELELKPDPCMMQIAMPNAAPQSGMNVFYGFGSGSGSDWTDDPSAFGIPSVISPSFTIGTSGYAGSIVRLGWINCASNAGNTPESALTFISGTDELTNLGIFIYFPDTKTVMQAYNAVSGRIPNGSSVKIIAIGIDSGGNLFSFYDSKTVNSNDQVEITMSATTDADLTALLDGL